MTRSQTYAYGEIVDIAISGAVIQHSAEGELSIVVSDNSDWIRVDPTSASVEVTRKVPADGEVHPGDLWRGPDGAHWFVIGGVTHPAFLDTVGRRHEYADVLNHCGPLERVHSARQVEADVAAVS